jgi:hypothetical protein
MNRIVAYTVIALLTATDASMVGSASPSDRQTGSIDILVDGVAQHRYSHKGTSYIEAIKGREYQIRLRNPYGVRAAVALSVDGLNTIDARHTSAAGARKWVLEPYQEITLSGWQVNSAEARRFEFTTEEKSYGNALGMTDNLGVISAVYYRERTRQPIAEMPAPRDRRAQERSAPAPAAQAGAAESTVRDEEYAATGMGRRTGHPVTQVWLDLEEKPAHTVNVRYEFRAQLVRLGVLPATRTTDRLQRREGARGFEPGFAPEVPRRK